MNNKINNILNIKLIIYFITFNILSIYQQADIFLRKDSR